MLPFKKKMRLWREKNGKKELERQKKLYKDNPSKREKKKELRKEKQRKLEEDIKEQISRRKTPVETVDDPFVIQCLFCSKSYEYTSILKHISKNELATASRVADKRFHEKPEHRHAQAYFIVIIEYALTFHWFMTQMTLGSMQVSPDDLPMVLLIMVGGG